MWRFIAASVVGTSHLRSGQSCQDRVACEVLADSTLIAATADGAGSAIMADKGAEIAVKTTIRFVSNALKNGRTDFALILLEAVMEARSNILSSAYEQDLEPRDLASTILAIIAGQTGGAAIQIGDGVIVIGSIEELWRPVFWPQHGEFANTTNFLTDEDADVLIQVKLFEDNVTDIALTTDGLESLALTFSSKSVYKPFFDGIFEPLFQTSGKGEIIHLSKMLESFLSSDRIRARTDDDVSLILATCRSQNFKP